MKSAEDLSAEGLLFFGRVTASLSHEMNNVMTIIGEASGLLEDYVALAEKGRPLSPEKLKAVSENIKRQVLRGKGIIKPMNYFGHSVGEPRPPMDINLAAEHAAGLMRRIAAQKGVPIEVTHPNEPVMAACHPFQLLHAVFLCVDMALESGASAEPIRISALADEIGPCLTILNAEFPRGEREAAAYGKIQSLLEGMGGTMSASNGEKGKNVLMLRLRKAE